MMSEQTLVCGDFVPYRVFWQVEHGSSYVSVGFIVRETEQELYFAATEREDGVMFHPTRILKSRIRERKKLNV